MKKDNDGTTETEPNATDETLENGEKKKKRLVISIRDLTSEEASSITGGLPPVTPTTGPTSTYMCCW